MNRKVQKASESGCEFILPDYMGDIKKLLFSRATVIPNGKFIGDGSLEISGTVEYELLYADSENNLSAINTSSDFSESFALGAAECLDSNEESRVANLKVRVTGPRKLSMKAEIETALVLCEEDSFGVEGDVFGGESSVETSTRVINYSNSTFKKSGEREYAEIMEKLGELSCDDVEIQLASACVRIDEAKAFEGYVEIKGENIVSAIVKNRDMPPYRIKKCIPFEERVEADGATPEMQALASGSVTSASVGAAEDNGECNAVANIICEYVTELIESKSCEVILDAYLPNLETKNKYRESEVFSVLYSNTYGIDVELNSQRESIGLSDAKEILAINAEVRSSSASFVKGGCEFAGELIISGVACETNADGSVGYVPFKLQAPFSENVNINCQIPQGALLEYAVDAIDVEPIFGLADLNFKCRLCAKVYLVLPTEFSRLYSCESVEGGSFEKDQSTVTVYYPKTGESLFDIAKSYHTTPRKIAMDNKLSESAISSVGAPDSLSGVKKLLIF